MQVRKAIVLSLDNKDITISINHTALYKIRIQHVCIIGYTNRNGKSLFIFNPADHLYRLVLNMSAPPLLAGTAECSGRSRAAVARADGAAGPRGETEASGHQRHGEDEG